MGADRSGTGWRRAAVAVWIAAAAAPLVAQRAAAPPGDDTCLACHGDAGATGAAGRSIAVDAARYGRSVHGAIGLACVDCHTDLARGDAIPHADRLARVDCATCHDSAAAAYGAGIHAEARARSGSSVAATCRDCHTAHDIRAATDPESGTYPLNLPQTCGTCHGNADTIRRGNIRAGNVSARYADSIHGRAVSRSGLLVAANCSHCHNSHDVRPAADPASRVHRPNVPATCGACHEGIRLQYERGVHGRANANGGRAPVCSDCHTAHEIRRADLATWRLDVIRECGTCHTDKIRTYRDTFHGQVTALGFVRVATCADCHGAHAIHSSDDPASMVSEARRLETCRTCHPSATAGFAQYDPHADKHDPERNPVLYWTARFMTWLLTGVFAFFGLHAVLWLPRGVVARIAAARAARRAGRGREDDA